jgi:hypothetical protein
MARRFGAGVALLGVLLLADQVVTADAQQDSCLEPKNKTVNIINNQSNAATVFINFGAESALNSNDLSFCDAEGKTPLNCRFKIDGHGSREIPNPQKKKVVMSLAFNAPVACGSTKAEITVNNPAFCDNADVSVVDGFNERIQIDVDGRPMGQVVKLGPPLGKLGNQQVFGVFPFACTICAGIVNPPCGSAGPQECHAGTETNPNPVCQYQIQQPNGRVDIVLLAKTGVRAKTQTRD